MGMGHYRNRLSNLSKNSGAMDLKSNIRMSFSLKGRGYDINDIKRERNRTNKKVSEDPVASYGLEKSGGAGTGSRPSGSMASSSSKSK